MITLRLSFRLPEMVKSLFVVGELPRRACGTARNYGSFSGYLKLYLWQAVKKADVFVALKVF